MDLDCVILEERVVEGWLVRYVYAVDNVSIRALQKQEMEMESLKEEKRYKIR